MQSIRTRFITSIATILFALLLISLSESVIGVDVARTLLGPKPSQEEVTALNRELGLDQSFTVRTYTRIYKALKGDLGQSYVFRQPVTQLLSTSLVNSLKLVVPALIIGGIAGLFLGIWVAYNPNGVRKYVLSFSTSLALLPSLVLSTLVVYGLGYKLNWISPTYTVAVILLSLVPLFITALTTYQEYTKILNSDYIRASRSLGFSEFQVASRYALKPAAVALTASMTNLALYLITATVFVEITFSLSGIGNLLLMATERFDFPIIIGISLVIVVFFSLMNTISGVALYVMDPRSR